jgi:DNA-binding transcriptional LysR family regulator
MSTPKPMPSVISKPDFLPYKYLLRVTIAKSAPGLMTASIVISTTEMRLHANTRLNAWSNWCARTGHDTPENLDHKYFEHFYLSLQAANAGLGVAMTSKFMVEQDLTEGRLIAPYGFSPDGSATACCQKPTSQQTRAVCLISKHV